MTIPALEVQGLRKRFGGVTATRDVSLTVMPGERRLLIGPNGAGKTTLFNLITGDLRADGGSVRLFGQELLGLPTRGRVRQGLGRTYQVLTLFPGETLAHNVALALIGTGSTGWLPWGAFAHRRALHIDPGHAAALEGLACVAAAADEADTAARLLGAAATWRSNRYRPACRLERHDRDRAERAARTTLGDAAFDAAYRVGAAQPHAVASAQR
jgi:branched-chain amino acid transport system ATP-binding protein